MLHERRVNVSGYPQRYVCATLKHKHDSKVSKELAVFRALLKCILSFLQIISGAIVQGSDEENKMAIKVCLEFITICCNMSDVRVDATDSALQYLFTNSKDNDFQSNLHFKRKSTFLSDDDDGSTDGELTDMAGGKCCKVTTTVVNEGAGKVDKTIDMDIAVPDEYDLHDFSITDQGVISFDGELMFE